MERFAPSPRIRRSPFHAATVAAGATDFTVYNKMIMPLSFGNPADEYRALTERVAMWDVAAERQVEITGPDAAACVQYLTARDLTRMRTGQGKYVAICDHDGAILNDPVLLKLADDRFWFSLADSDMLLWCRAVAAERGFDVSVFEPDVSPLAVQGPLAEDLVADLFGDHVRSLRFFWFIETELRGIPLVLCRSGWSKQGGFELFLQDHSRGTALWDIVAKAGERYNIAPGGPNHIERVESGLLSWGGDTTVGSNPFEAGMAAFVDTDTDADYIGKAALQRIAAEGPQRLATGVVVHGDIADGWMLPERTPIWRDGTTVGTLSAVVWSPKLQATIGFAQVERALVEQRAVVEVEGPDGLTPATLTPFPFETGDGARPLANLGVPAPA